MPEECKGSTQQNGTAERHDFSASSPIISVQKVVRAPSCDAAIRSRQHLQFFLAQVKNRFILPNSLGGTQFSICGLSPTLYRYRLWRKSGEKTHLGCKKLVNDGRNYQTQLDSRISSIDSKCLDPKKGLVSCHPSTSLITKKKRILDTTPIAIQRHRPPDANTTKSFSSGAAGASLSSSINSTKMPMVLSNWIAKYMYI